MRWLPQGYGGARRPPEEVKREGWREQGVLVVSEDMNAFGVHAAPRMAGTRTGAPARRETLRRAKGERS